MTASPIPADKRTPSLRRLFHQHAFRLALGYFLAAGLWILFSGKVAQLIAPSEAALVTIEEWKGWGFVLVTALALYVFMRRTLASIRGQEQTHTRQYAALAELGERALAGSDPARLMDELVAVVVSALGSDLGAVLEFTPDGDGLVLRAGRGWREGQVTNLIIPVNPQNAQMLLAKGPRIVDDLSAESRFATAAILREHNVMSGLTVVIPGQGKPFGILGSYSRHHREFTTDDANFLQAVANLLAAAIQRTRAERALRESEERNRAIVTTAEDGIITIDDHGNIESFNPAAERLFGYRAAEVMGQSAEMLMSLRHNGPHEETNGRRKDGSTFMMDLTMSEMHFAGRPMWTGIVRDITERAKAGQSLQRHIQQLSTMNHILQVASAPTGFEQVLDVLLNEICEVFDADAADIHLMDANVGLLYLLAHKGYAISDEEKYFHLRIDSSLRGTAVRQGHVVTYTAPLNSDMNLPREQLERLKAIAITPVWARGEIRGTLAVVLWSERVFTEEELALLEALGRGIGITIENARLYAEAQSYTEMLKLRIDERTEELQKALVHAQSADRTKSALLSTVSHEMRTPLSSIIGFSSLIMNRKPDAEKTLEFASAINAEARRLSDLINDFLDLQRIESGREVFHFVEVDLAELINDVVRKQRLDDDPLHTISVKIEPVPKVLADMNRVRQVLLNLLSNAIKYSPNGGEVMLTLSRLDGEVIFTIHDQGLGLPADEVSRVFDHFYRGEAAERYRIRGTGLGLSLCREIIQAHNGRIWGESPGANLGATFGFALPIFQAAPIGHRPLEESSLVGDKPLIVVVEDDTNFAAYLTERLELEDYTVYAIHFKEATVNSIAALSPALIILDILQADQRPGWVVMHDLQANPATQNIPCIICSILNVREQAREQGAAAYIPKPVDEVNLLREVSRLTKKSADAASGHTG